MRIAIIGGGISGLFAAIMLQSRMPDAEITLLEKRERLGGRVFTKQYPDGSSFESGAGRFGMDHKIIMALIRRYGMKDDIIPISNSITTRLGPLVEDAEYRKTSPVEILKKLRNDPRLTKRMACENTIEEIVRKLYGDDAARKVVHEFEYDSEIQIARAQTSLSTILETFRGEFGILKGGLSRLTREMEKEGSRRGVTFMTGTRCERIAQASDGSYEIHWKSGVGMGGMFGLEGTIHTDKVVLCTPRKNVREFMIDLVGEERADQLYGSGVIQDEPLLRVYARFPTSWIDTKIVTRKALRYIIPVSSDPPIVMISYTDGPIARIWSRLREQVGDRETTQEIMRQLRALFPRKSIPDPIWVSFEEYPVGASYWKTGDEDVASKKSRDMRRNPTKNVYVCGEFLSTYHQAWIEGALETTLQAVKNILSDR